MRFVHGTLPQRVRFATGEAATQLAQEIRELGASRLMVIAAKARRELAERVAGALPIEVWHDEVVMHVPLAVAERARGVATARDVLLEHLPGAYEHGLAFCRAVYHTSPQGDVVPVPGGLDAGAARRHRASGSEHPGPRAGGVVASANRDESMYDEPVGADAGARRPTRRERRSARQRRRPGRVLHPIEHQR